MTAAISPIEPAVSDRLEGLAIHTRRLRREFGEIRAVDNVSLDVEPGTVLALLGPNGAGKTTWLRLIRGVFRPTQGECTVWGQNSRTLTDRVARRISYLGDGQPPRWARLRDIGDLQASVSADFDRVLALRLLHERDLSWDRRWSALSRGQQRWALFVIGLAARPELWLLDEPTDGLDTAARRELYDWLRIHCNEQGTTVVVSTHLIGDIERVADDVALLHRGRLLLHAPLESLREEVREIEVPDGVDVALPATTTILADIHEGCTRLIYVRESGSAEQIEAAWRERIDRQMSIRPVGLETLYLAMTRS